MRMALKSGVYFCALLLFLVSTNYYSTQINLSQKVNGNTHSAILFVSQDSGLLNFIENKNFQSTAFSQQFVPSMKHKPLKLVVFSPTFNSWKICIGRFYESELLSNIYSLEVSDIIYPFHDFL